jgi:hypothetical protein
MKPKLELIKELDKKSYYHAFFPEEKPEEIKIKIIKFYFEEDIHLNPIEVLSIDFAFTNTIPSLLLFDKNHDICSITTFNEYNYTVFDLNFYSCNTYTAKKYRTKRIIKNKTLLDYLWPLAYYESYEYLQSIDNKHIVGMMGALSNTKLFKKYFKQRTYVNNEYLHAVYAGNKSYIIYYPNTFID